MVLADREAQQLAQRFVAGGQAPHVVGGRRVAVREGGALPDDDGGGGLGIAAQHQPGAVADVVDDGPPAERAPRRRAQRAEQLDQLLGDLVGHVLLQLRCLLGRGVAGGRAPPGMPRVEGAQDAGEQRRELLGTNAGGQDVFGAGQLDAATELEADLGRLHVTGQPRSHDQGGRGLHDDLHVAGAVVRADVERRLAVAERLRDLTVDLAEVEVRHRRNLVARGHAEILQALADEPGRPFPQAREISAISVASGRAR